MESLEELTPERVKDLSREEAQILYEERNSIIARLKTEMELLHKRIWEEPEGGKCPHCGGSDLMAQRGGRFFCRSCNMSIQSLWGEKDP
jgi:hypothetical protein